MLYFSTQNIYLLEQGLQIQLLENWQIIGKFISIYG